MLLNTVLGQLLVIKMISLAWLGMATYCLAISGPVSQLMAVNGISILLDLSVWT